MYSIFCEWPLIITQRCHQFANDLHTFFCWVPNIDTDGFWHQVLGDFYIAIPLAVSRLRRYDPYKCIILIVFIRLICNSKIPQLLK